MGKTLPHCRATALPKSAHGSTRGVTIALAAPFSPLPSPFSPLPASALATIAAIVSTPAFERPRVPTITVGLRPHPVTPAFDAANELAHALAPGGMLLATMLALPDGGALFEFRLEHAALARLALPPQDAAGGAADGLWQHTCFEVFLGLPDDPAYREFNFSPGGDWAVYDFLSQRQPNPAFRFDGTVQIRCERSDERFVLEAVVPAQAMPLAAPGTELLASLCAVLEREDGTLEYWAVQHSGAQPDFHARESFVLMLKTATAPGA